jgi:type I restriction enzyme, S subunit
MTQPWREVALGELIEQNKEFIYGTEMRPYKKLSVRLYGRGVVLDKDVDGASIKMARNQIARSGQVILSMMWGKKGAVGIVPPSGDGALSTTNFYLFDITSQRLREEWLNLLLQANYLEPQLFDLARGTTDNAPVRPKNLLACKIPLPSPETQQSIVSRVDAVEQKMQAVNVLRASIEKDIASLLAVRFQETLNQAPLLPLREVAPLVRRNVHLEPNQQYKELGARSFGKGLFVKPDFDADAATWEKPVWIKTGDIVFSNIKAWEGAIGVAKPEHDGFIASHRYLTAVVKPELAVPEYLLYYLLSETGLTAVNEASPGTADRNRTTKQSALEAICVPVPSMAIQKQFVKLKYALEQVAEVRTKQMISVKAMLPALCNQVLS